LEKNYLKNEPYNILIMPCFISSCSSASSALEDSARAPRSVDLFFEKRKPSSYFDGEEEEKEEPKKTLEENESSQATNGYSRKGKKTQLFIYLYYRARLGSVAGPVIQATGRSEFEDGVGSGDFVSVV
jgi:hypothetical protein